MGEVQRDVQSQRAHPTGAQAPATADPGRLAAVYERYADVAYGLALCVLGDEALASGVVAEALLASGRNGAGPRGRRLLADVHRRAVELARRRSRGARTRPGGGLGPTCEALRRLPADEREPIELAYYQGLTQREIAEVLELSLEAVRARTLAGLTRLRGQLGDLAAPAGAQAS
jgi:RNA polymerase sigma-70 factor (ECF subfamily)